MAQTPGTKKADKDEGPSGGKDVGGPQGKTTRAQEEDMAGEKDFLEGKKEKERKTSGIGGPGGRTTRKARGWVAGRLEGQKERGEDFL